MRAYRGRAGYCSTSEAGWHLFSRIMGRKSSKIFRCECHRVDGDESNIRIVVNISPDNITGRGCLLSRCMAQGLVFIYDIWGHLVAVVF